MHRRTADFIRKSLRDALANCIFYLRPSSLCIGELQILSATLFVMLGGLQILSAALLMVNLQVVASYAIILVRINKEELADKEQNCDCNDSD